MCACDNGGQCVAPELGDPENTGSKFVLMGCACVAGFTGRLCTSDIDACELNGQPCYPGVECEDLPAPANITGYKCGPCPAGYSGNGAKCTGEFYSTGPRLTGHECSLGPLPVNSFWYNTIDWLKGTTTSLILLTLPLPS